tara:strand:+ start:2117 stop:2500 length:384 start_codon:yes stop_codon:yes gene_type:complete
MSWKKRSWYKGKFEHYSVIKKLKRENKISEEFEIMLNNLTLEEIIAIKLEAATKAFGGKSYGLPIWRSMREITQHAVLKFAVSACRTNREAASFLGISAKELRELTKKYNIKSFFEEIDKKDLTDNL